MTHKLLLGSIVITYVFLSFLYVWAVPLGESPDEPGHLQCVEQVARTGRLPIIDPAPQGEWWQPGVTRSGRMCYHMPLYYLAAGYLQRSVARITGTALVPPFPPHNPDFGQTGVMFQHEPRGTIWSVPEPPVWFTLRVAAILLGLVTLYAGHKTARRVFPRQETAPLLATAILAGWPQFLFLGRAISNDVLATALAAGTLIVLLDVGRPARLTWAALLSAVAVAAKASMLFTAVIVLASFALEMTRFPHQQRAYWRALLGAGLIWTGTALLLLGHPTTRQHLLGSGLYWNQGLGPGWDPGYWRDVGLLFMSSGWGRFGWMNVVVPVWQAYLWWELLALLSGTGMIYAWRTRQQPEDGTRLAILGLWMVALLALVIRINTVIFQPQFRFALASLPIWAAFAAGGMAWLLPSRGKAQTGAVIGLLALLIGVNLWIVAAVIQPFYGS